MKKISKERIRSLYNIRTDFSKAEADVVARRPMHQKWADRCNKWTGELFAASLVLSILVIAIPVVSDSWARILFSINVLHWLATEFSRIGFFYLACLAVMLFGYFYRGYKKKNIKFSEKGYPFDLPVAITFRHVVDAELFPVSREEEVVFLFVAIDSLVTVVLLPPCVVGLIVFACR